MLTNFPYALPLDLGFTEDSGIYEFPVTFEDEEYPPLSQRIDKALDVIQANAENDAINVLLIHSNESHTKLSTEEGVLARLPPEVTASDMDSFARFWRARDHLHWKLVSSTGSVASLSVTADEPVDELTFEFRHEIDSIDAGARCCRAAVELYCPTLGQKGRSLSIFAILVSNRQA